MRSRDATTAVLRSSRGPKVCSKRSMPSRKPRQPTRCTGRRHTRPTFPSSRRDSFRRRAAAPCFRWGDPRPGLARPAAHLARPRDIRRDRGVYLRSRAVPPLLGTHRLCERAIRGSRPGDRANRPVGGVRASRIESAQRDGCRYERLREYARRRSCALGAIVSMDRRGGPVAPRLLCAARTGLRCKSLARLLAYPPESGAAHSGRSRCRSDVAAAACGVTCPRPACPRRARCGRVLPRFTPPVGSCRRERRCGCLRGTPVGPTSRR